MIEFDKQMVIEQLRERPIIADLAQIHPEFPALGYKEKEFNCFIAGFKEIIPENLPIYQKIFKAHLGPEKKSSGVNPKFFAMKYPYFPEALNRMNGFLFGGEAIRHGELTLDQLIECGIAQQGGCNKPIINLFTKQSCYGKISEHLSRLEIVRICPHLDGNFVTCEYMLEMKSL